jgi:flagellar hook protein FlgE
MLNSIYIGLSGLQAYSEGLQRISNNVTNLNSTGFKTSSVTFANLQAARDTGGISLQSAGPGHGGGVGIVDPRIDFRAGELRQTGRDLDLAVDGSGLLVLLKGDEVRYARTGSFDIDAEGHVVLGGTEWRLATLDDAGRAVALSIDASRTSTPVKTTKITFADNLSSTATSHTISGVNVYDATGAQHVWQLEFTRAENASDWTLKVTDDKGTAIGEKTIGFSGGVPSAATATLSFEDTAHGLAVSFDFSRNVTSFSSGTVSSLRAAAVDGHGTGTLTGVGVNDHGELELAYSNGEKKKLGAVALASFRDPQVLVQEAAGIFSASGSADVALMASDDPRVGAVVSRRLEASNVDLSREFGDLILIQRGYQASSQIISVANDMLQQLFNIRGQG